MIWYSVAVATWIPRWWIDVATTVHYYEAILAALAILVWHFYQVIFDPDVYPVNFAFIDGRVPEELYKEEHELAYEKMMRKPDPTVAELTPAEQAVPHSEPETAPDVSN